MSANAEFTERVRWDGHYSGAVRHVDRRTYEQLKAVERILGEKIVMYQGSWSHGSLSADTHAGAGAADIGPTGRTTWRELESAGRQVGGACWYRPWTNNLHC